VTSDVFAFPDAAPEWGINVRSLDLDAGDQLRLGILRLPLRELAGTGRRELQVLVQRFVHAPEPSVRGRRRGLTVASPR
jgi:hypothetical protein